jgi:hypothetical protein
VITNVTRSEIRSAASGHDPAKTRPSRRRNRNDAWRDYGNRIGIWAPARAFDGSEAARRAQARNTLVIRLRAAGDGGAPTKRGDEVVAATAAISTPRTCSECGPTRTPAARGDRDDRAHHEGSHARLG